MNRYEAYLITNRPLELGIGSRVRIAKGSRYYGSNPANPADVDGTIEGIGDHSCHPIFVQWDNGKYNDYNIADLEAI